SVIITTATSGAGGSTALVTPGTQRFIRPPAASGRMTTCTVLRSRPPAGTSMRLPASTAVSVGVITTASIVDAAVIATDRATSARERNAMTFDAVPPGQPDTRIRPTASGVGSDQSHAMVQPSSGIARY